MKALSDKAIGHLREVLETPDLAGTRYRLVERIGRGGMGTIYLAEDASLDRRVALKVLHLEDDSGEAAARMLREARIIARLEHPGIVPVHDAGTLPDGRVYYAMKLVQGQPLGQVKAGLSDLLGMFQKICDTVAFAHSRGLVHRDLKPDNIMAGAFGEVLVMDWGVAKVVGETEPEAVVGTAAYMAPEQARGDINAVDARADIYALGAILRGLIPAEQMRPPLASICRKAMELKPADRYAGVEELRADVACFLDHRPVSAHRESLAERAARVISRYRMWILLVLAYLVMRTLLIVIFDR